MATQTAANPATKNNGICKIPYYCPSCEAEVGVFVPVNDEVMLDSGDWMIRDGMKYCHRCGRLVHIKQPRDPWPVLVARYLEKLRCERTIKEQLING